MTTTVTGRGLTAAQLNLLLGPLNNNRVRQHKGQSHLEAWDVRRWLTRIFGYGGWTDEILSCEVVHEQIWPWLDDKGKPVPGKNRATVVYRVTLRLIIRDDWGNEVGHWDDGATGDAINQASVGDAHDLALKGALSQALKRCAANLGDQFGLSLYNKDDKTTPVVVRTVAHSQVAIPTTPETAEVPQDAPVTGGELDEAREGEPQTQVASAVARKAQREQYADPPQEMPDGLLASVNIALREHGHTTDEARHAEASRLAGRPIGSTKELSPGEARHILRALTAQKKSDAGAPAVPPEGWTDELRDQLVADLLAALLSAGSEKELVAIGQQIADAVKAGKVTAADRETLLAGYQDAQTKGRKGARKQPVGAGA